MFGGKHKLFDHHRRSNHLRCTLYETTATLVLKFIHLNAIYIYTRWKRAPTQVFSSQFHFNVENQRNPVTKTMNWYAFFHPLNLRYNHMFSNFSALDFGLFNSCWFGERKIDETEILWTHYQISWFRRNTKCGRNRHYLSPSYYFNHKYYTIYELPGRNRSITKSKEKREFLIRKHLFWHFSQFLSIYLLHFYDSLIIIERCTWILMDFTIG